MEGIGPSRAGIVGGINELRAARGYGAIEPASPAPGGPRRNPFEGFGGGIKEKAEAISRLPREITGKRIFGKSVGDLAKEAAVSGAAGALFRIGLGSAGVGGIALGATAGAGVAGIMEIRRQAIENQQAHPERTALKEKLKSLNPHDKKRLVLAIGRGAVFGAAGGVVGGYLSETGFGEAVKGAFSRVGELKDAIGANFQTQVTEAPTSISAPIEGGRSGVIDVLGGALHNVGLKAHEITGIGVGEMPWDARTPGTPAPVSPPEPVAPAPVSPGQPLETTPLLLSNLTQNPEFATQVQAAVGSHLATSTEIASQFPDASEQVQQAVQHKMEALANQSFEQAAQEMANSGSDNLVAVIERGNELYSQVLTEQHDKLMEIAQQVLAQPAPDTSLAEAAVSSVANMPAEVFLQAGSNPWEVSKNILTEVLGRPPTNLEILEVTRELAKSSHIAVPQWNIDGVGFISDRQLPVGFKLIFDDSVKSMIKSIASK